MITRHPSITWRRWPQLALAGLFATSGTLHLVSPEFFLRMMPPVLPQPGALVFLSGLAELACAAGLVRGDRWAGPASAAVLVAIFPGNVQMALDAGDRSTAYRAAVYVRLPLQVPLIIWAISVARNAPRLRR